MAATGAYPDHSITEDRYITFGLSEKGRLVAVNDALLALIEIAQKTTRSTRPPDHPKSKFPGTLTSSSGQSNGLSYGAVQKTLQGLEDKKAVSKAGDTNRYDPSSKAN